MMQHPPMPISRSMRRGDPADQRLIDPPATPHEVSLNHGDRAVGGEQHEHLPDHEATVPVDELGKCRGEEHDGLRIGRADHEAVTKFRPAAGDLGDIRVRR